MTRGLSSNIDIMKTLFGTHKYVLIGVLGLAVAFVFGQEPAVAARKTKHRKKVEITNDTIVLHPTVRMSPADEKAMDAVLEKNSKTLYKIDTVENGKVTHTKGVMPEGNLTGTARSERTGTPSGNSHKTHQVICVAACNPQLVAPPFSTAFKPTDAVARQRLIQDLKPILTKYK